MSQLIAGRCAAYKKATKRFLEWLRTEEPVAMKRPQTVASIVAAARAYAARGGTVPGSARDDLARAIAVRTEVREMHRAHAQSESDADRAHDHFLAALACVSGLLRNATEHAREPEATQAPAPELTEVDENAFAALALDDDEAVYDIDTVELERPSGPQKLAPAVVDAFGVSEAFAASCLLLDVEEALSRITEAWRALRGGVCARTLLEATAVTNAAVRHVNSLAAKLEAEHPALATLEHVTAAAYLGDAISEVRRFGGGISYSVALSLVSDTAFGNAGQTGFDRVGNEEITKYRMINAISIDLIPTARLLAISHVEAVTARAGRRLSRMPAGAVVSIVAKHAVDRFVRPEDLTRPSDDCLSGGSGLLFTSQFLRCMEAGNMLCEPRTYSTPRAGYFGRPWDERHPARSTLELMDYSGGVIPALVFATFFESRLGPNQQIELPDLHLDECMPLWPLLRAQIARTRDRELLPVGLVVALHAALLSVVAVNGDERCAEVGATLKVGVAELRADTRDAQRALAAVDDKYGTLVTQNAKLGDWWLEQVWDRASTWDPTGGRSLSLAPGIVAQRDNALVLNPWVAGQQLLTATLGVGIGVGLTVVDAVGQARLVLHVYNALRRAGQVDALVSLDVLSRVLEGKALWFGGRAVANNFLKHYYHAMGMGANARPTDKNRALVPYEGAEASPVFRRCAALDLADLATDGALGLDEVLAGTRAAFAADECLDLRLNSLGVRLANLVDEMVDVCDLRAAVRAAAAARGGRRGGDKPTLDRRAATHQELTAALLIPCDMIVDPDAPLEAYARANRVRLPVDAGKITVDEAARDRLSRAARHLAAFSAANPPATPVPPPSSLDRDARVAAAEASFLPPAPPKPGRAKKKSGGGRPKGPGGGKKKGKKKGRK